MALQCPRCNVKLIIAEQHNVEIDRCPKCKGIWLDKGELDKIINYSYEDGDDEDDDTKNSNSFLSDLFEE